MQQLENALTEIEARQRSADAVAQVRAELAPVASDAQQALREFNAERERWRLFFDEAITLYNRAAVQGIQSPSLHQTLTQAKELLEHGGDGFIGILNRIDMLSVYTVHQGYHRGYATELKNYRANIGALAELAKRAEGHLAELAERVAPEASKA